MHIFLIIILSIIFLSFGSDKKISKIDYKIAKAYFDSTEDFTQFVVELLIINHSRKTSKIISPIFTRQIPQSLNDTILLKQTIMDKKYSKISFYLLDSSKKKYYLNQGLVDCGRDYKPFLDTYYNIPSADSVKIILKIDYKFKFKNKAPYTNCINDGGFRTKPSINNPSSYAFPFKIDKHIKVYCEYSIKGKLISNNQGVNISSKP